MSYKSGFKPGIFNGKVFIVTGGGSGIGIEALINNETDIANSSREIKPNEIEIEAHFVNRNKIEGTYIFDELAQFTLEALCNLVSKLTIDQKPKEIIVTAKGLKTPNTWNKKEAWVKEIETLINLATLPGYLVIGWEETDRQLLLRFIQKTADPYSLANDCWKDLVRLRRNILMYN